MNPISAAYQPGMQGGPISAAQPSFQGMPWASSGPQQIIQQNPQQMQAWESARTPLPAMQQAYRQAEGAAMQPLGEAPSSAPQWLAQNPGKSVQDWQSALQSWQSQYQNNLNQQPGAQAAFQWAGGPGRQYFKPQGMFGDLTQMPIVGGLIKDAAEVIGRPGDIVSNPAQWFGAAASGAAPFLGGVIGPWAKVMGLGGGLLQSGVKNPMNLLGTAAMAAAPFAGGGLGQALRYGGEAFNMGEGLAHGMNPMQMLPQMAMPFLPAEMRQPFGQAMNAYNLLGRAWGR